MNEVAKMGERINYSFTRTILSYTAINKNQVCITCFSECRLVNWNPVIGSDSICFIIYAFVHASIGYDSVLPRLEEKRTKIS